MFIFFPYKDDNEAKSFPIFTWALIVANLWVFFAWQLPLDAHGHAAYFSSFVNPDSATVAFRLTGTVAVLG